MVTEVKMNSVTLSNEQWQSVLATMETGIKSIGQLAFVSGGQLMNEISRQLESSESSPAVATFARAAAVKSNGVHRKRGRPRKVALDSVTDQQS